MPTWKNGPINQEKPNSGISYKFQSQIFLKLENDHNAQTRKNREQHFPNNFCRESVMNLKMDQVMSNSCLKGFYLLFSNNCLQTSKSCNKKTFWFLVQH